MCGDVSIATSDRVKIHLLRPNSSCVAVVIAGCCFVFHERLRSVQVQNFLLFHHVLHIFFPISHLRDLCSNMGKRGKREKRKAKAGQ